MSFDINTYIEPAYELDTNKYDYVVLSIPSIILEVYGNQFNTQYSKLLSDGWEVVHRIENISLVTQVLLKREKAREV